MYRLLITDIDRRVLLDEILEYSEIDGKVQETASKAEYECLLVDITEIKESKSAL